MPHHFYKLLEPVGGVAGMEAARLGAESMAGFMRSKTEDHGFTRG